jgi:hypothetical protein
MRQPLTIERTMTIILLMLLFALATRIPLDTDTWWHLRAGQWMVENGQIIAGDPFSHTATGIVRVQADWLSQVILYGTWALLGDFGMALFTSLLATGGMYFLFRSSEGNTYLRAFLIVLGAATAAVFWSARPQMFTFFLSAVVVYLLYLYKRRGVDRLWLFVPIMLLWGNLHGGFFIGLLLIYGTIAGEILNLLMSRVQRRADLAPSPLDGEGVGGEVKKIRKLALVAIISTLILLINPAGLRLLLLPFETFTMGPLRQYIQEWNPPNFADPSVLPFLVLLIATVIALIAHWRSIDWKEVLLVAGSGYLAVTTSRNISFFAVVATPILSYHLHRIFEERGWVLKTVKHPSRHMVRLNTVLLLIVGMMSLTKVLLVLDQQAVETAKEDIFPVLATDYLNRENPSGKMFNSYNWGGYLMYHAPQYPVYIDGRTDLYGNKVLEYVDIAFANEGWQERLDREGIDVVVVESASPLADELRGNPGWYTAHGDEVASVFTRLTSSS